jgi:hypothetical protein
MESCRHAKPNYNGKRHTIYTQLVIGRLFAGLSDNWNQEVPGRRRRSSEEVKRLVLEFEASGLRQNEFCRNHGLALSTLRRQLKKRRFDKAEPKEGGRLVAVELVS